MKNMRNMHGICSMCDAYDVCTPQIIKFLHTIMYANNFVVAENNLHLNNFCQYI